MNITRLKPSKFEKYEENKDHIDNKFILYSDRQPQGKFVEYEAKQFNLGLKMDIDLPGSLKDPLQSLYKIALTYEWDNLTALIDAIGYLFIYNGFVPSGPVAKEKGKAIKQLKFLCYPLISKSST
ncbi:MAG: hypothetical protein ACXAC7_05630 [Candidatus Hodarchaeales archaeon]